jgi:hypothetical protein
MAAYSEKAQVGDISEKPSLTELENGAAHIVLDAEASKKLLRRIDWRVMPVVSWSQPSTQR